MPLCKPFTITTTDGYIVDMCGPYEGTKNDADITKKELSRVNSAFSLMKPGDIVIVDRGFGDVVDILEQKGYTVMMPALKKKRKQLPTNEANASRIVTKLRWVVEAVHGQLKQKFKLLHHQLDNKMLQKAKSLCRIASFLNNMFGKRFKTDESMSDEIINRMLNPTFMENSLAQEIEKQNLNRKTKPFVKLNSTDLEDFTEMTERDLKILFTGTYQLAMAISYIAEILNENNELDLKYLKASPNIIGVSVRSQHINSKVYKYFIDYKPNTDGYSGIRRYACDCPNGLRTVGCCCHVAAIIYYLSNARYQSRILEPAENLSTLFREEEVNLEDIEMEDTGNDDETCRNVETEPELVREELVNNDSEDDDSD